jgi:hypothetical protein
MTVKIPGSDLEEQETIGYRAEVESRLLRKTGFNISVSD